MMYNCIYIPYSAIFWQRKILADLANSTRNAKIFPATILLQLIYKSTGANYYNSCEDGVFQIF